MCAKVAIPAIAEKKTGCPEIQDSPCYAWLGCDFYQDQLQIFGMISSWPTSISSGSLRILRLASKMALYFIMSS